MKVVFWNLIGLRRIKARDKLRSLVKSFNPSLVILAKPKVHYSSDFCKKLKLAGMHYKAIHNSSNGDKGNIWIMWCSSIQKPKVIHSSEQSIIVEVGDSLITGMHAASLTVQRRSLWNDLLTINILDKPCCGLIQAPKNGILFSWCNNRADKKRIVCNLDRDVFNDKWLEKFSSWGYKVGSRAVSDHSTLCGSSAEIPKPINTPFRAMKVWKSHPDFLKVITQSWGQCLEGNPIFVFMSKMKRMKRDLKEWNWLVFGDVNKKLKQIEDEVMKTTAESDEYPSNTTLLNKLITVRGQQEILLQQQKEIIQQKSRVRWLKDGASNSRYFHIHMKLREAQNMITELENDAGIIIIDTKEIANELVKHFETKFKYQEVDIDEILFECIPNVITREENMIINSIPSEEEIKAAVFELNPESAPWPDGFAGWFYRHSWIVIGHDFIKAVQFCWSKCFIPNGLNANFLKLLPKVKNAKTAKQFRPNGLMNFSFKVFTKIWATRLENVINKVVSPQQGAFIKERTIQEQVALASEMINEIDIKRRGGNFGLKLGITQAYDSLSWKFLFQSLHSFGFSDELLQWLQVLLQSARVSVLVNGGPEGYFEVGRGLRQGDPLSPMLFVLVEDILSRNITKMIQDGNLKTMVNKGGVQPSHIFFAYDIFFFCNGEKKNVKKLMNLLNKYQRASDNYPIYSMSVYKWPKKVIRECERIIRNFLWSGDPAKRKLITLEWNKTCYPISEGGLGLRRLEIINKAILMKLPWRIQNENEDWSRFFLAKYTNKKGEWISYYKKSSIWPGIKWILGELEENSRWIVGDGKNISAWKDNWVLEKPLQELYPDNGYILQFPDMKVSDFRLDGEWILPTELM
ncbi:uncharacterized protein LOC113359504 [Papaver somniferum]|uniref:uncharacterized protein LOC113359504 n=1 Tax=Papaver somniferum TaxID=3469 RepID=UPI000E6FCEB3|nr:uncharacterized protein LOC113359504 [Papaver somniferum]